jgi:hypothetical protein
MARTLNFEPLDERIVPAATVYNLTSAGATAALPSGAIVKQTDAQPTGTGFIQSFVRVQSAANGGKIEQGFNTDNRPLQFDENKSPVFTRSLHASDVPTVLVDGTPYREFLLDINQKSSSPRLSLDQVRIFFADQPNLKSYDAATKTLDGRTAAFDLDAGGDASIMLDARLNSGSGSGDMYLLVPSAAFAAAAGPTSFAYLYSVFGEQTGATANGGFEEWAVRESVVTSAPAGTASLSGNVSADLNGDGVYESGMQGVTIKLTGVNDMGQSVSRITTTDEFGNYSFTGLRAGTYTIVEDTLPKAYLDAHYIDGEDFLGTVGGVDNGSDAVNDQFSLIQLLDGDKGINYNFGEILSE